MIKKLFLLIVLILLATNLFADEILANLEEESLPVLNENTRKIREDIRGNDADITTNAASVVTNTASIAVNTAAIAAIDAHQASQAQATALNQVLTGAWQDVTGATITLTTGANPCLVIAWAQITHDTINGLVGFRIDYDGGALVSTSVTHSANPAATYPDQQILTYLHTPTAAAHTWHVEAYGPAVTTLTGLQCFIQVIELKL